MPLPPIHICPQEPWEAQEYAHRDRSRVKCSFCERPGVETRHPSDPIAVAQYSSHVSRLVLRVLESWLRAAKATRNEKKDERKKGRTTERQRGREKAKTEVDVKLKGHGEKVPGIDTQRFRKSTVPSATGHRFGCVSTTNLGDGPCALSVGQFSTQTP